jgi:D-xylose transport system ATP-binding protein
VTSRILILDEPTSALSSRESGILLDLLLKLKSEGLTIVYVSHKLDEVFAIADRITILRNGRSVETVVRTHTSPAQVVQLMLGRKLEEVFPPRSTLPSAAPADPPLLRVRNWSVPSPRNPQVSVIADLSFDLASGEILGLVGLLGAGRTELVESLFGLGAKPGTGQIEIDGRSYTPTTPTRAVAEGLALIPEDRRHHGLMLQQSIRHNLTSACLKSFCRLGQIIDQGREIRQTELSIKDHGIKALHGEVSVGTLSGGNQQKVVIGKWLLTKPRLLFLDDPTRGVDVGAKAEIYRIIQSLAKSGIGILLISSENEEVLSLSHRILALRKGRVVGEFSAAETDPQSILELCAGGA